MARPQKTCSGDCEKRGIQTDDNLMCDWFDPKRKGRYRVICRNCKFFKKNEIKESNKSESNNK